MKNQTKDIETTGETTRVRVLTGIPKGILVIFSAITLIGAILYIFKISLFGWVFQEFSYYYTLIALLLGNLFLLVPPSKKSSRKILPWYDALLAFLAFSIPLFFAFKSTDISTLGWEVTAPGYIKILSLILLALVVEAIRRTMEKIFTIFLLIVIFLPMYAHYIPEPFTGKGFPFWRMVTFHAMGPESILGVPMNVVGTLLIGFIIFGIGMSLTGGGGFFFSLASSILGRFRGGQAKICVIASGLFGMISGSVVSNVLTNGPITIPAMVRSGYPKHYAAGLEAVAGTGGVIMPPIMGAAAFLISQFLNIPYSEVTVGAAIPAIAYYLCVFIQTDAFAAMHGLAGLPKESLPRLFRVLKDGWYYVLSFVVLVVMLFIFRMDGEAPFIALAVLIVAAMFRKLFDFKKLIKFLETTGDLLSTLMATMLGVGLIIGGLNITGISYIFSSAVTKLAGGNIYLLLIFCAVACFILGMGVSITACYIILVSLAVPSLIQAGLDPLATHLFVLYWATISYITPPVAIGAYCAAGIIGASPMKTGYSAMRLGVAIYYVPFLFVLWPCLILHYTSIFEMVISIITLLIGISLIGWGIEGYFPRIKSIGLLERCLLIISGLLLGFPQFILTAIGFSIFALFVGIAFRKLEFKRHEGKAEVTTLKGEK